MPATTMNSRAAELVEAVQQFQQVHYRWANDRSAPETPPNSYWDSLTALIDLFDAGDIPHNCRQMADAVAELAQQLAIFDENEYVIPQDAFYAAREALEATLASTTAEKPYRESVKELARQDVPHEQIARIWGLTTADGRGRADLILKELESPGSVIGPDYVHPDDREAAAAQATAAKERLSVASRPAPKPQAPACKETPEELHSQGVEPPQASKMLGWTMEHTEQRWKELTEAATRRKAQEELDTLQQQAAAASPPIAPAPYKTEQEEAEEQAAAERRAEAEELEALDPVDPSELAEEDTEEPADETAKAYTNYSLEELRQECSESGIGLTGRENRATLLRKLRQHLGED